MFWKDVLLFLSAALVLVVSMLVFSKDPYPYAELYPLAAYALGAYRVGRS